MAELATAIVEDASDGIAQMALWCLTMLRQSGVAMDDSIVDRCRARFARSIDEEVIALIFRFIRASTEPPVAHLPWILDLVQCHSEMVVVHALHLIQRYQAAWGDDVRPAIAERLLGVLDDLPFNPMVLALEILLVLGEPLPDDVAFFQKVVDGMEALHRPGVLVGIIEMITVERPPEETIAFCQILEQERQTLTDWLLDEMPYVALKAGQLLDLLDNAAMLKTLY
jgi:hypothetical protein